MSTKLLVKLKHCRAAGYCLSGIKQFCSDHNFDWKKFKTGADSDELLSYNLGEFNRVVQAAKQEANQIKSTEIENGS